MDGWPENDFQEWLGRGSQGKDLISDELVSRFRKTLPFDRFSGSVPAIPLGLHWCLAPIVEPPGNLGPDGHPRLGLHFPPIPLSRRMWAGGSLEIHDVFRTGDPVTRSSRIEKIERKSGRSGPLVFLKVRHLYDTPRGCAVSELQDIVYREPAELASSNGQRHEDTGIGNEADLEIDTDPVLLFRYSALTFNGHRIHYDHPYATHEEGYDGLVVHGPLIATLLANLATAKMGAIDRFSYRGRSPLICGEKLFLRCASSGSEAELTAFNEQGRLIMTARARSSDRAGPEG